MDNLQATPNQKNKPLRANDKDILTSLHARAEGEQKALSRDDSREGGDQQEGEKLSVKTGRKSKKSTDLTKGLKDSRAKSVGMFAEPVNTVKKPSVLEKESKREESDVERKRAISRQKSSKDLEKSVKKKKKKKKSKKKLKIGEEETPEIEMNPIEFSDNDEEAKRSKSKKKKRKSRKSKRAEENLEENDIKLEDQEYKSSIGEKIRKKKKNKKKDNDKNVDEESIFNSKNRDKLLELKKKLDSEKNKKKRVKEFGERDQEIKVIDSKDDDDNSWDEF